jgi:hypothetical protein
MTATLIFAAGVVIGLVIAAFVFIASASYHRRMGGHP